VQADALGQRDQLGSSKPVFDCDRAVSELLERIAFIVHALFYKPKLNIVNKNEVDAN
jgi:hypothetical protein